MKFFLLRDIPDDLWIRVKRRAAHEGRSLRKVITLLLKYYAAHGLPEQQTAHKR